MSSNVYRLTEIIGSSETSIDDAVSRAVSRASTTVRNVEWFQVEEIRGQVVDGAVAHYQVDLKIGFRVDD